MSEPTAADLDAAQCILDCFRVYQIRAEWGVLTVKSLAEMIARRMEPERKAAEALFMATRAFEAGQNSWVEVSRRILEYEKARAGT